MDKKVWYIIGGGVILLAIIITIIVSAITGRSDTPTDSDNSDQSTSDNSHEKSSETSDKSDESDESDESSTTATSKTESTSATTSIATASAPLKNDKIETKKETIKFEIEYKENKNLEEGKENTIQQGKDGSKTLERTVTYTNGVVTSTTEWKVINTTNPTKGIIEYGTKEKVIGTLPAGVEMPQSLYDRWQIQTYLPKLLKESDPKWEKNG